MTEARPLIAVVDDEEPVRKALMRLMRSAGLSVETFDSGAEFLKSIDTRLPDCVVLDLCMPQIDGFSVQASLARNYAALPVIIVTGHDLPNARERAIARGASAFLRKPVHAGALLGAISAATACAEPGACISVPDYLLAPFSAEQSAADVSAAPQEALVEKGYCWRDQADGLWS